MTAPLDPGNQRQSWWQDEGGRIAAQLHGVSAVLVIGANPEHAARAALGIARAASERRHVALGDLIGDLAPLYAVAGGEDAFGLSDCLRQGLPLNDIARPAPGRESLFILPAGSPPVSSRDVIAHARWPKLIKGFAKAGALLVLVAEPDAPGIATLEAATDGVVLVDTPAARARGFRVLAAVCPPEPVRAAAGHSPSGGQWWKTIVVAGAIAVTASSAWYARHRATVPKGAPAAVQASPRAVARAARVATAATPLADTVRLADPVNPADTTSTAAFAVEVMAANTLAGANSFLANNTKSSALSGATVSPVAVGGSASVWYKVVAGAAHARAGADSLLTAVRHERLVRGEEGRVVKVPFALVLAEHVERTAVPDLVRSWRLRGFGAYAMVQQDGSVRLLAGAFETPAQAAPLASALRAAGVAPVVAFRTGRTY